MIIVGNETSIRRPQETEDKDAQLESVEKEVWGATYTYVFEAKNGLFWHFERDNILSRMLSH